MVTKSFNDFFLSFCKIFQIQEVVTKQKTKIYILDKDYTFVR